MLRYVTQGEYLAVVPFQRHTLSRNIRGASRVETLKPKIP